MATKKTASASKTSKSPAKKPAAKTTKPAAAAKKPAKSAKPDVAAKKPAPAKAAKAGKTAAPAKAAKAGKTAAPAKTAKAGKTAAPAKAAKVEKPTVAPAAKPAAQNGSTKADIVAKTARELLKRNNRGTPATFKAGATTGARPASMPFTMDEVREVLRKREENRARKQQEQKEAAQATADEEKRKQKIADDLADKPVQNSRHAAASLADILGFATRPAATGELPVRDRVVPKKWAKYYKMLVEMRNHVRNELNLHSNDTLKRSQKDDAGDIATSADAGTDNFDRDFALSLLSNEQEALKEIEAAIERIFNDTYGVCEITGKKISAERLEAVPFTRFSLEGQLEFERTARRRVQRTGAFLSEGAAESVTFGDDDGDN